jgi:hypothetical protein
VSSRRVQIPTGGPRQRHRDFLWRSRALLPGDDGDLGDIRIGSRGDVCDRSNHTVEPRAAPLADRHSSDGSSSGRDCLINPCGAAGVCQRRSGAYYGSIPNVRKLIARLQTALQRAQAAAAVPAKIA